MRTESGAGCERLPLYILAGGRSRRFGGDKARAPVDGEPLIVRIARSLSPVASATTVVAATDDAYEDLSLATVADDRPGLGPAGGVATALRHRRRGGGEGWLLLSACDWLRVESGWARRLVAAVAPGARAVLFDPDQPLFGMYHTDAAPHIARMIAAGELRMQTIAAGLSPILVAAPESFAAAVNVNRRGDLPGITPAAGS